MKHILRTIIITVGILCCFPLSVIAKEPLRFAVVTDTHFGHPGADSSVRLVIEDINRRSDIDFVVLTGDITESGRDDEFALAADVIGELDKKYYILTGNHDTKYPESWFLTFRRYFGAERFKFERDGFVFYGIPSGFYLHDFGPSFLREDIIQLNETLSKGKKVVLFTHFPTDFMNNVSELRWQPDQPGVVAWICGHMHRNHSPEAYGIPTAVCLTTGKAKPGKISYNIADLTADSLVITTFNVCDGSINTWWRRSLKGNQVELPALPEGDSEGVRWSYDGDASLIGRACAVPGGVVYGNTIGEIRMLSSQDGNTVWNFRTKDHVISTPVYIEGNVYCGSIDGTFYCLNARTGKVVWKLKCDGAIGSKAATDDEMLYFGTSSGSLYAVVADSGEIVWKSQCSSSLIYPEPQLIGGTLCIGGLRGDAYGYNTRDGKQLWTTTVTQPQPLKQAPIAIFPTVWNGYFCSSQRDGWKLTGIDPQDGDLVFSYQGQGYSPSCGSSPDGKMLYARLRADSVFAFRAENNLPVIEWKYSGSGPDCKGGQPICQYGDYVYVPTADSGTVYKLRASDGTLVRKIRTGHSLVTGVTPLPDENCIVVTLAEGKILCITE